MLSCSFCSLRCAFLRSFSIIGAERPIAVCAWHNLNLVERFRERVEPVCLQCKFEHFPHFLHGRVVANNLKRSSNRIIRSHLKQKMFKFQLKNCSWVQCRKLSGKQPQVEQLKCRKQRMMPNCVIGLVHLQGTALHCGTPCCSRSCEYQDNDSRMMQS